MVEVKIKAKKAVDSGKFKPIKLSLLVESGIVDAYNSAESWCESCPYIVEDIVSVTESRIKDEANPLYKKNHPAAEGWTVYLERKEFVEDMKVKKLRYPILVWSEGIPSAHDGELHDYLEGVDPEHNEFDVIKISHSPVVAVL